MNGRGFIFSLDAFVAFVLLAVAVGIIIFASGMPRASYSSLEQAHQLAHDTLQALTLTSDGASGGQSYLEQILGGSDARTIMKRVAGGDPNYRGIIPRGYGYSLEAYNFADNQWRTLYDAGADLTSDRRGKNYTKLRASATSVVPLYTVEPRPGASPYCNLNCKGYDGLDADGNEIYANPCNITPCEAQYYPNFIEGNHSIQLVRLVVYT